MPRAPRRSSARDDEPERRDAPAAPAGAPAAEVLRLQRTAGNQAVAAMLARNASGAPPIEDRTPIDDLGKKVGLSPVDRVKAYAKIAGTDALDMDPAVVNDKPIVQEGVNLGVLTQADKVGAQAGFLDANNTFSGGAPPATAKGVAIVVNARSARFQDEDYMVAAIRHEMVHARLMKLTLEQRAAWQQKGGGKTFSQFVDQRMKGADAALVKDRFFGGHMDETLAYAEGFLTAFFYAPIEAPQAGDRAWIAHFKGFSEEYQTARANSGPIPKKLPPGVDERNLAIKESANAVEAEAEKLVKEFCDKGGPARRKNLAAWMLFLDKGGGLYRPALKMIYKAATGKAMP
jgi:hypothetical protein